MEEEKKEEESRRPRIVHEINESRIVEMMEETIDAFDPSSFLAYCLDKLDEVRLPGYTPPKVQLWAESVFPLEDVRHFHIIDLRLLTA